MFNRIFWQRFIVLLFVSGFIMTVPAAEAGEKESGDKAAVVNGTAITRSELEREFGRVKQQFAQRGQMIPEGKLEEVKKEILTSLIDSELLYQQSRKMEIQVSAEEVAQKLASLKEEFSDAKGYEAALAKMNMTEKDLTSDLEKLLSIQMLIRKVVEDKVSVNETESRQFYQDHPDYFQEPAQVKASHILVKVDQGASEEEKAKRRQEMESMRRKLSEGEDFAALAREHSDCPSSEKGGDLGYFSAGQMVPSFEKAAFALEQNQISEIVETRFGYHLIKVEDKKAAKKADYSEVKDKIDHFLKQEKSKQKFDSYIQELRDGAKIETFL